MYSSRSRPAVNTRGIVLEWPNGRMLRLPETIDRGVDTPCGCNCQCLSLWWISVARGRSGFVMTERVSGLGMGVGRFWRPLKGVGVKAMPNAGLDTTQRVEVPPDVWCATTAYIWCGSWSICWPSLCSRLSGSHVLSDICNARIVQWRWGDRVLTLDCRGYRTPSLRGIPLASRYGNASISRCKLRIPRRHTLLLILTINKTSNISCNRSRVKVRALGRHSPILMFHVKNVGTIACSCICNGRQGRLLFEWPGRVLTKKRGAV